MWLVAALSDTRFAALLGFAGITLTVAGGIIVAFLGREVSHRRRAVNKTVENFESAWNERGRLIDGYSADLAHAHERITEGEAREADCQQQLREMNDRIAVLEAAEEAAKRRRRG